MTAESTETIEAAEAASKEEPVAGAEVAVSDQSAEVPSTEAEASGDPAGGGEAVAASTEAGDSEGGEAEEEVASVGDAEDADSEDGEAEEEVASVGDAEDADSEDGEAEEEPAEVPPSPYDLPGEWYVVHSYSGYENKVKANLETRSHSMHLEDRIFEVSIPMEDVVEYKGGKKVTVPRKVLPGYILVRLYLDDDTWYAVRNTPGVTGFVGSGSTPVPLSRREVERFLGVAEKEEKKAPRFKPEWEISDSVRVVTGPFADFNGIIESINLDQSKVTVLVNIFGRDTPVELGFEDILKN